MISRGGVGGSARSLLREITTPEPPAAVSLATPEPPAAVIASTLHLHDPRNPGASPT